MTTDDVILAGYAAEPQYRGKLKVVGKGFSDETYGVGIKKGNTALVDQVNAALAAVRVRRVVGARRWSRPSRRRATRSRTRRRPAGA